MRIVPASVRQSDSIAIHEVDARVAPCPEEVLPPLRVSRSIAARPALVWLAPIVAAVLLAACATDRVARDAERRALYEANAGAPVQSASYRGSLISWTPLGDSAIALWTRPSQAYLVRFVGSCPDIEFASAIRVTNQGGRVYARFDEVVPLDRSNPRPMPCRIAELRPLDVKAIRAGERGAREAQAGERAAGS